MERNGNENNIDSVQDGRQLALMSAKHTKRNKKAATTNTLVNELNKLEFQKTVT